jgi:pimeloyl-ACP methyl ester carboxylesterase
VTAAAGTDAAGVPVVLVHGFASSAEHNWRRTGWLDLLADEGREAIAVDLPGHGLGPHPASSAGSPEEIVAAAIGDHELVDAIGFSAGARVLLRAAAAQPQRFRRVVLIGVGPGVLAPADPGPVIAALDGEPDPEDVRGLVFRRLAENAGNDRAALIAFLRLPQPPLTAAELAGISCPVLVVLGDRDPAGPGDGLVAELPDAQLVTLPGVDHFGITADVRCMDAVLRFLARPGPARPGPARPGPAPPC